MKSFKIFSFSVVFLILGACSSEDFDVIQQPNENAIQFVATIGPANGCPATRTIITEGTGDDNGKLLVAWKVGDQIALIHHGIKETVSVSYVDDSGNATISGTITAPAGEEEDVLLVYPAASVDATGSGTGVTPNVSYASKGFAQDGTIGYIGEWLDARRTTGTIVKSGGVGTLKENVLMGSEIAIWKLNLTDGTSPLNATKVTLKLGGQAIAGTKDVAATNEFYLCVVPGTMEYIYSAAAAALQPVPPFTIEATVGSDTYIYTKTTTLYLSSSTFYQSTVTMTKQ